MKTVGSRRETVTARGVGIFRIPSERASKQGAQWARSYAMTSIEKLDARGMEDGIGPVRRKGI
jgi:hypothetical protein